MADEADEAAAAPRPLLADLHCHAADDPRDTLKYSSEMLIEAAAAAGVEVLSITLHEQLFRSERLRRFAEARGVLLIAGIEQMIDGKHVVLLNPSEAQAACTTFAALRALPRGAMAVMAPHPYFPAPVCLGRQLERHADLFDAIEYSTMYCRGLNFNRRAVRAARRHGLPLLGTSDSHSLPYRSSTLTWIRARPDVYSVIEAIRAGRCELVTEPRSYGQVLRFGLGVVATMFAERIAERVAGKG